MKLSTPPHLRAANFALALISFTNPNAGPTTGIDNRLTRSFESLRRSDQRLSNIAFRISLANDRFCDRHMPATGILFHAIDQFSPDIREQATLHFGFPSPIAIELIVPGSPASASDVQVGDGIAAVNAIALNGSVSKNQTVASRDRLIELIQSLPTNRPIDFTITRNGRALKRIVYALQSCRISWEVSEVTGLLGQTDDTTIQLGRSFVEASGDYDIAVIFAHELAHSILNHNARLAAAGVKQGLLSEFGRNLLLNRRAEVEADELSLYLLSNSGYNPEIAPKFWEGPGRKWDRGIFRRRYYSSPNRRAQAMRKVIDTMQIGLQPTIGETIWSSRNSLIHSN